MISLAQDIDAAQQDITLSGPLEADPGNLFRLGNECVQFGGHQLGRHGRQFVWLFRAQLGTIAVTHAAGTQLIGLTTAKVSGSDETSPSPFAGLSGSGAVDSVNGQTGTVTVLVPTADEKAALDAAASPTGSNPFATIADVPLSPDVTNLPTDDEKAALDGAASPSVSNVLATMADLPADELTADELAAVQDAASPSATNVFATVADLPATPTFAAVLTAGDAGGAAIPDVADPTDPQDAATKAYVDTSLYLNVKSFGALGNGSDDDTAAIQAAIDATPLGGTLFFPFGGYLISDTLLCTQTIRLLGEGATEIYGTTIWQLTANTTAISMAGNWTSDIEYLHIRSNVDQSSAGAGVHGSMSVRLNHVHIFNFYDCLHLDTGSYMSSANLCRFIQGIRAGIYLDGGFVNNFTASQCSFWACAYGLLAVTNTGQGVQNLRIRDCVTELNTVAGVSIDGGNGGAVIISGTYFEDLADNIIIGPTTEVQGAIIEGNWFGQCGAANYCTNLQHVNRATLIGNGYGAGTRAGDLIATANTTNVAVINQQLGVTSGLPSSSINVDPSGANPWPSYRRKVRSLSGLVGYWRLGEKSGTAAIDEVGTTNGVYVNAPTLGVVGGIVDDYNTAVTFNGSTQLVTVTPATAPVADHLSVVAWIKRGATGGTQEIMGGGLDNFQFDLDGDGLVLSKSSTGVIAGFIGNYIDTSSWHMAAFTKDGTTASQLYWDGAPVGSSPHPEHVLAWTNGAPVAIGGNPYPTYYFNGTIGEVALFNRALTAAEVANLWHIGHGS